MAFDVKGSRESSNSELETAVRAALSRMAANAPAGAVVPEASSDSVTSVSPVRWFVPVAAVAAAVATIVVAALLLARPSAPDVAAPTLPSCAGQVDAWPQGAARAGADKVMVPDTPTSAVVCQYGTRGTPYDAAATTGGLKLHQSGTLTGRDLAATVAGLNGLRVGARHCFISPRVVVIVVFVYPSGPSVTVKINDSACPIATNGRYTASGEMPTLAGYGLTTTTTLTTPSTAGMSNGAPSSVPPTSPTLDPTS
ncbi:hypothetical protein SAMN04515671_3786 [Nakamurella panacisegetis]|uniref:Uncharacterized protein n=1 Tax=Nakamurella panacisegetis TaxID=1090615 RepID=A0A1H0RWS9_9ACTN|nr:hypothetical protein [Nakamurella panacisegetis]SDP33893.1 hypothetical protein SAMN04515671_3786 [Nakamurella panacisegetis]